MTSQPEIRARFILNEEGRPKYTERSRRHYRIRLSVEDVPRETDSVVYSLHTSYRRPFREVFREDGGDDFAEVITSFGDYDVVVVLAGRAWPLRKSLFRALEEAEYEGADGAAVAQALEQIREQ